MVVKLKKVYAIYIILLSLILLFTACDKNEDDFPAGSADLPSKITIGAYSAVDRNPLLIGSGFNEPVNLLIYDGLYSLNEKFEPVENLANEMRISNSGYDVDIVLKPNITFHNGEQFSADDVYATINYILSNGGYYEYNVRNIESVTVTGSYSLQIKLNDYTPNIKMQLTFPILSKNEMQNAQKPRVENSQVMPTPSKNGNEFVLNGTGAYKVSSETKGKQILLIRNPNYHNLFQSNIKEVEINLIPDKMTSRSLAASGILDVFYAAFYDDGLKTVTKTETKKLDYETDEYTFIKFNLNNEVFLSKHLRKALSLVIDRKKIVSDIYMSHASEAFFPVMPSSWAYPAKSGLQKDVASAKKLLDEPEEDEAEKEEIKLTLLSSDKPTKQSLCNQLVSDFSEIGINLKVTTIPEQEFKTEYFENSYDLYLVTTNIGYDLDFYEFMDENGKFSFPLEIKFENYRTRLAYTDKKETKLPVYSKLCDEFYENMPHIPLLFLKNTLISSGKTNQITGSYPLDLYFNLLRSNIDVEN